MTWYFALSVGDCTTVYVPGWAAVAAVAVASAPRLALRLWKQRQDTG